MRQLVLKVPRFSIEFDKTSLAYMTPAVWNDYLLITDFLLSFIDTFKRHPSTRRKLGE